MSARSPRPANGSMSSRWTDVNISAGSWGAKHWEHHALPRPWTQKKPKTHTKANTKKPNDCCLLHLCTLHQTPQRSWINPQLIDLKASTKAPNPCKIPQLQHGAKFHAVKLSERLLYQAAQAPAACSPGKQWGRNDQEPHLPTNLATPTWDHGEDLLWAPQPTIQPQLRNSGTHKFSVFLQILHAGGAAAFCVAGFHVH